MALKTRMKEKLKMAQELADDVNDFNPQDYEGAHAEPVVEDEPTPAPVKQSKKAKQTAEERAAAQAKRDEAKAAKAEARAAAKAAKPKREPSPYAGFSPHQRNRRIAWDKYGPGGPYDEGAQYIIEPGLRAEIHAELLAGTIRPSAKGKSFGGDRYLLGVARRKWPEGAITIVTSDVLASRREAAEAAKLNKTAEREAAQLAKAAEREAAKQAKAAEREAAKQAKAAGGGVEDEEGQANEDYEADDQEEEDDEE